jgi:hypothetical protein
MKSTTTPRLEIKPKMLFNFKKSGQPVKQANDTTTSTITITSTNFSSKSQQ